MCNWVNGRCGRGLHDLVCEVCIPSDSAAQYLSPGVCAAGPCLRVCMCVRVNVSVLFVLGDLWQEAAEGCSGVYAMDGAMDNLACDALFCWVVERSQRAHTGLVRSPNCCPGYNGRLWSGEMCGVQLPYPAPVEGRP